MRMFTYLLAGTKHVFALQRPGRRLVVRPDDVQLASYPKSGNTWTRFLIANLMYPDRAVGFGNIHQLVLDPEATSKRRFDAAPRPRIIKTHGPFDPRYRKVIYIVRDARDVAISQYHYQRKIRRITDDHPLEKFIADFISGDNVRNIGSWGENVASWMATRRAPDSFLLVRYEDLLADTSGQLTRIGRFLGIEVTAARLQQAQTKSSVENMRKSEKEQGHKSGLLKGSRTDISFIRAAKSGGWRTELPAPFVAQIEAAWGHLLELLGYELRSGVSRTGAPRPPQVLFGEWKRFSAV